MWASDERVHYTDGLNSIRKSADISGAYRQLHVTGQTYRSRPNRKQPPTAISGSNPDRSATEPANFLSGLEGIANKSVFPDPFAPKTTTMRRTNRLKFRSIRALSARFLRTMIRQWLFPMHINETLACVEQTFSSDKGAGNLSAGELENLVAEQRCTATSIAITNSNPDW